MNLENEYYEKYLKYKNKYLSLKKNIYGGDYDNDKLVKEIHDKNREKKELPGYKVIDILEKMIKVISNTEKLDNYTKELIEQVKKRNIFDKNQSFKEYLENFKIQMVIFYTEDERDRIEKLNKEINQIMMNNSNWKYYIDLYNNTPEEAFLKQIEDTLLKILDENPELKKLNEILENLHKTLSQNYINIKFPKFTNLEKCKKIKEDFLKIVKKLKKIF